MDSEKVYGQKLEVRPKQREMREGGTETWGRLAAASTMGEGPCAEAYG